MAVPFIPIAKVVLGGVLGAGKVAATGAVKGAAAGKKMASSMMKRSSKKGGAIEIRKKVIPVSALVDTKSLKPLNKEKSKKSSGVESIDSALDRIDSTLAGIIATVEDRSNLQRNVIRKKNIRKARVKKSIREDELESKNKFGMKIPKAFKSAFGIMDFFKNILIGSLVLFVLNNIETIIDTLKNVFETIKDIFTKIGDFLKPLWDVMKWIISAAGGRDLLNKGEDLIRSLQGLPPLKDNVGPNAPKWGGVLSRGTEGLWNRRSAGLLDWMTFGIWDFDQRGNLFGGKHSRSGWGGERTEYHDGGYVYNMGIVHPGEFVIPKEKVDNLGLSNADLSKPEADTRVALDIMSSVVSPDDMTSLAQVEEGRESLKPINFKIADQSSLSSNVESLKTIPSYAISGGDTIVMMGGNEQPSVQSSGGSSGPVLIAGPSKKEVLNSFYDSRFKSSLYKVG